MKRRHIPATVAIGVAAICLCRKITVASQPLIVPAPRQMKIDNAASLLEIPGPWHVQSTNPEIWQRHLAVFSDAAKRLARVRLEFNQSSDQNRKQLIIEKNDQLGKEEYCLTVDAGQVSIEASHLKGLSHATATLLQLLGNAKDGRLAACRIHDWPTCEYRSFLVDIGRNPHSLASLKETIDLLWYYKVDSMQLHMTDDQRFAFPSRAYPRLVTEKGEVL